MYVRFIVLAPRRRRAFGLFRADTWLLDDPSLPQWQSQAIDEHLKWFRANLRVPRARGLSARAICWFRPDARSHIARAREFAWLISEVGHPTAMITTRHVGEIIYRDEVQIVAKPDARTRLSA